jgi:hypothetical protein
MMFWRVLAFGEDVARELAATPAEHDSVAAVGERLGRAGTFSPDFAAEELFGGALELAYWAAIFFEVAERVYRRAVGNQQDQTWQVATIWAAFGLGRLLDQTASQVKARERGPVEPGPAADRGY